MRIRLVLAFWLALSSVVVAGVSVINLPAPASDFAIDPQTGVVAAVHPARDSIAFYAKLWTSAEILSEEKIGKAPGSVVFKPFGKQRLFVALSTADNRLFVFDAQTRRLSKEVKLSLPMCRTVRASNNPADPYVYYTGGGGHDARLARYNLETGEDEGAIEIGGMGGSVANAAVSADGTIVYTLGPWSPTGFQAHRIEPRNGKEPPRASQLRYEHDSRGGYVPDLFATTVAAGTKIYSADLSTEVVALPEMPVAFSPYDPAVITLTKAGIRSYSTNTYRAAKTCDLPMKELMADVDHVVTFNRTFQSSLRILWEPGRKHILFCREGKVGVIPYADLAVDEPMLGVDVDGSVRVRTGEPVKLKLTPRAAGTKIAIESGPKTARLEGDTLTWTPGVDDVGRAEVVLSLSSGTTRRTQKIELTVSRPFVQLPFVPTLVAATDDARTVLACESANPRRPDLPQPTANRLAVLDIGTGKLLAERGLPQAIGAIAIDGQYAYVGLQDSDALYVLSAKDLTDVKRLFTPGRVTRVASAAGRLFVGTQQGKTLVLSLPALEPVPAGEAPGLGGKEPDVPPGAIMNPAMPSPVADGWLFDGVEYDAAMKTPRALRRATPFADVAPVSTDHEARMRRRPDSTGNTGARWGVWTDGQSLFREGGQTIGGGNRLSRDGEGNFALFTLQSVPLAAEYSARMQSAGEISVTLDFRELVGGQVRSSVRLAQEAPAASRNRDRRSQQSPLLECVAGKTLLVSYVDRLFVVPLNEPWVAQTVAPLLLSSKNTTPLLIGDTPAKVSFDTGGRKGVRLSLLQEMPGAVLADAELTIDPTAFRDFAVRTAANRILTNQALSREDALLEYRRQTIPLFKRLTGTEARGVPVACTFTVVAQDEQLQQSTLKVVGLIDLAPEDLLKHAPASAAVVGGPTTRPADLEARVRQLENEVQKLQAKIDLLTELVRDRKPGN